MESSFSNDEFERVLQQKLSPKLLNALPQFQRDGVKFVYKNKGRAIIADEMGLGKTVQAIACACVYRESWPVLIVAPSSARHHWKMELQNWLCSEPQEEGACTKEDIVLIDSPTKTHIILNKPHQFAIVSYHYLTKLEAELCSKKYKMIIVDESHFLKNGKAKRTKSMNAIAKSTARMLLLTGTPALSRPYELFTQLHLIAPNSWGSEHSFCQRYCRGRGTGTGTWGGEAKMGASHCAELHATLFGTVMIRRLKKDTLNELPSKSRHIVRVEVLDKNLGKELMEMLNLIQEGKTKKRLVGPKKYVDNFLDKGDETSSSTPTSSLPENRKKADGPTNLKTTAPSIVDNSVAYRAAKTSESKSFEPDFSLPPSVYSSGVCDQQDQQHYQPSATQHDTEHQKQLPQLQQTQQYVQLKGGGVHDSGSPVKDLPPTKRVMLLDLFTKSGIAKVDMVIRSVETFLSNPVSGKLLIFAHHKKVLDRLSDFLTGRGNDHIRIDGSTASKMRHQKMIRFQTMPSCRVAVLAITAAGVAITLTAASTVFFAELFWTPGAMLQAEDRVHRIGQLSPVNITYFLGKGTVDDVLWPLLQKKMKTLGELFEGERNTELVASEGLIGVEDKDGDERATATSDEGGGEDLEVAGLVEDISMEEEQNLFRREAEGGVEENEDMDTETDPNLMSGYFDAAPQGDVSNDIFMYDGLAQAMLHETSTTSSSRECVLLDDEEDERFASEARMRFHRRRQFKSLPSSTAVVDLVDGAEEKSLVGQRSQSEKPRSYICIDLDSDNEEGEKEEHLCVSEHNPDSLTIQVNNGFNLSSSLCHKSVDANITVEESAAQHNKRKIPFSPQPCITESGQIFTSTLLPPCPPYPQYPSCPQLLGSVSPPVKLASPLITTMLPETSASSVVNLSSISSVEEVAHGWKKRRTCEKPTDILEEEVRRAHDEDELALSVTKIKETEMIDSESRECGEDDLINQLIMQSEDVKRGTMHSTEENDIHV